MDKYKIFGLHCQECADDLKESLLRIENGEKVKIDYKDKLIYLPEDLNLDQFNQILEYKKLFIEEVNDRDHDHHHGHSHSHSHSHSHDVDISAPGKMLIVFLLNLFFSIAEFILGNIFRSSAILSDAVHDLGDALSIGLAFVFEKVSTKEADTKYSFGYSRFSLLGALITSTVLIFGSISIILKAIPSFISPHAPNEQGMFWMAIAAIIINGFSVWFLRGGENSNQKLLNVHVLEDMFGWIAVLLVSIVLKYTDWYFLDPMLSLAIAGFILYNAVPEFIKSVKTFLNSTPHNIPISKIEKEIRLIDKVHAISHLHIWSIDGENNAFTVTAFVDTQDGEEMENIRREIRDIIAPYKMVHYTIEVIPDTEKILKY
ncbi:cation transporter [Helcococcus massiliensis]|uniref:cation transporter n=1 Tax=Helcococcus massiliensis TaxID=2040290 RepID=UPI000CDECD4B|nr:cation transporter [Helcococcus massiliensis]